MDETKMTNANEEVEVMDENTELAEYDSSIDDSEGGASDFLKGLALAGGIAGLSAILYKKWKDKKNGKLSRKEKMKEEIKAELREEGWLEPCSEVVACETYDKEEENED